MARTLLPDISVRLDMTLADSIQSPVVDMRWTPICVNDDDLDDIIPISDEALLSIAYEKEDITLAVSADTYGNRFEQAFHSNGGFTVKYLLDCVLEFEKTSRMRALSTDGFIDAHHVFFEGLEEMPDGTFYVVWGS